MSTYASFPGRPTQLHLGYYDGDVNTVQVHTTPRKRPGTSQGVILEGQVLDRVCAAALHLTGYAVEPGLRALGLRKRVNGVTSWITIDLSATHLSLSGYADGKGLRLWVETGIARRRGAHAWQNFSFNGAETEAFLDRLCEAAGWERDA